MDVSVFLMGIVGGAIAELLKWYQLRESPNVPVYARSPVYWIVTLLMIAAGGALAVWQGVDPGKPLLAVNIGLTAPLIFRALAGSVPAQVAGARAEGAAREQASVLNFLAWR